MKFYRTSIGKSFILFSMCSIAIMAILFRSVSIDTIKEVKSIDTENYLKALAMDLEYAYEMMDTTNLGFYILNDELYIGDKKINADYTVIDRMKKNSGAELSIFCRNKRVATTILDENGERYTNTTSEVWDRRGKFGKEYFDKKAMINGKAYYGYYYPIKNRNRDTVGLAFAGIPVEDIEGAVRSMNMRIIRNCIAFAVISILAAAFITSNFLKKQNALVKYLEEIDKGEFDHEMPQQMLEKTDEYGVLSRYLVSLNESLSNTIQRDGLTKLYNRRATMQKLERYVAAANSVDGKTFTFVIGDIDFFKKVNDTYGHNCGDAVLIRVSSIMKDMMKDYGFAGRWGGEEFVLVFKGKKDVALARLEEIAAVIREQVIEYDEYKVSVTMTFGMTEYAPPNKLDYVLSKADKLLYEGKEGGRNRIVT